MKKVMFISSVGGHLTQILELKKIFNNYEYVIVTEKTDVTKVNIRWNICHMGLEIKNGYTLLFYL